MFFGQLFQMRVSFPVQAQKIVVCCLEEFVAIARFVSGPRKVMVPPDLSTSVWRASSAIWVGMEMLSKRQSGSEEGRKSNGSSKKRSAIL